MKIITIETVAARRERWHSEAAKKWQSLWFFQKWWLADGRRIYVGKEQLQPENPDNPETSRYLFCCSACHEPDIDIEHGYNRRLTCSVCPKPSRSPAPTPNLPPLAA